MYRELWVLFLTDQTTSTISLLDLSCSTPYYVAFAIDTAAVWTVIGGLDLSVNCIFMTDVLINFRTSYPGGRGEFGGFWEGGGFNGQVLQPCASQ